MKSEGEGFRRLMLVGDYKRSGKQEVCEIFFPTVRIWYMEWQFHEWFRV